MQESETEPEESIVAKRANYERMKFVVCSNGYVNVCNQSHNDDKNHTYSVKVENGEATGCSCPHATHRDAHCKHQVAVEDSPIVVSSASAASHSRVATDGGQDL